MNDWNAGDYDRFGRQRQRPAHDLLAAVPRIPVQRATDLGCGSGLSTQLVAARWPDAQLVAVDNSPGMLDAARDRVPGARFVREDIKDWQPDTPQDLVIANASLQWIPGHPRLFPRLLHTLSPRGVLAVQMPNNLHEPSHRLMRETARMPRYRDHMRNLQWSREDLLSASAYYDCLSLLCDEVDIWETRYRHVLDSAGAIVDWFATTALKPYLDALPDAEKPAFRQDYLVALQEAYPEQADGRVLLAMPRLFVVARRGK